MRSSIRVSLTPEQLCNLLDLVTALGGKNAGRSYASCLQQLVEHTLKQSLDQGLIHPVAAEEASRRLSDRNTPLQEPMKLESFNVLPSQLDSLEKIKSRVGQAVTDQESESNNDLDSLFGGESE